MRGKRILALLLAMSLSASLLPVPVLATEAAEGMTQATAAEGTEPSDSGVKAVSEPETEPEEETEQNEPDKQTPASTDAGQELETEPAEPTEPVERAEFPVDSLCYAQDGTNVKVQQVEGRYYLFLPASADSKQLVLSCNLQEGQHLYVAGDKMPDGLDATEGVALDTVATPEQGQYTLKFTLRTALEDGTVQTQTKEAAVQVMQSANLSTVYLTSAEGSGGRVHVDQAKANEIQGSMVMVRANGEVVYDGALTQIKARGNSTFQYYPKKSYQIKLDKKTKLISGTGKGKTWVLLAGYTDAVKLADQMWKDVGVAVNAPYTARAERVDLYFDGEYRGSYALSEKNQINGNRISITDMEEAYESCNPNYGEIENNPQISRAKNRFKNWYYYTNGLTDPEQKGGFLLELNGKTGDEASWFKTSLGFGINVKSPEFASQDTMRYISEYFQEFEDAITAQDGEGNYTGRNPNTGRYYYEYCDLDSLAQQYLLNTVSSNRDGLWRSFYFYMDTDGKLYAGPLWDMELSLGVGWKGTISPEQDWMDTSVTGAKWGHCLMQIPSFRAAVKEMYERDFVEVENALLGDKEAQERTGLQSLRERAEEGRASVAMDYVLWPSYLQNGAPNTSYDDQNQPVYQFNLWPEGTTYDDIVQVREEWLSAHKAYLDQYFAAMEGGHGHVYLSQATPAGKNQHKRVCKLCGQTVQEDCTFLGTATSITAKSAGVLKGTCLVCEQVCSKKVTLEAGKTFRSGNLYYQVTTKDQTVTVTKGTKKTLTSVSIPATVSYGGVKYRVTAVGKEAFRKYTKLKSVSIGSNVKRVGQEAFAGCTKLSKVTGCAGIEIIEKSAFHSDKALKSVSKLSRCKTVGAYAFYKCYKLSSLPTGTGITSVGAYAFGYDNALTKVSDLRKCTSIGDGAFYGCKKLRQIGGTKNRVSLYKVSTVGKKAFRGCTAMTNFYAESNLTKLGSDCFYGDKKLKTITLNSKKLTRESVGKNAFKGIHSKAVIRVPSSKKKEYQTYLKGKGQGKKVKIKGI